MSQPAQAAVIQPIDTITILECAEGRRATKRIHLGPGERGAVIDGYDAGTWFVPRQFPLDGPDDLFRVLEETSRNPRAFVIRGELHERWRQSEEVRRTSQPRGGLPPSFVARPRRWLAIDIDKAPQPAGCDPAEDPDGAVEHLIGRLPPEFQDASCWWQWTSGQGFKGDTLNARLWFWLDKPASDLQLRAWAKSTRLVDSCLYSAAEPHYVAAPILEVGVHDPVPRRYGIRRGLADEVVLTLPDVREVAAYTGPADGRERTGDDAGGYAPDEVAELLRHIPNSDLPYDEWLGVGVKVKAAAGADGEEAFVEWSSRSGKFNEREARTKFRSLNGNASDHALYHLACEHGHNPFKWSEGIEVVVDTEAWMAKAAANGNRPTLVSPAPADDEDWSMPDPIQGNEPPVPPCPVPPVSVSSLLSSLQPAAPRVNRPSLPRYDLGGLGGAIADWMVATAIRPQPELSLLASLSVLSVLYGRRYRDERGTRPNLYTAGICDTGGGKDHARKCVNKLVEAAKQGALMMGGKAFSGAGIMTALGRYPRRLSMIDEFGLKLKEISCNPGSGMKDKLMELYSSSSSVMRGDDYAEATKIRVDIIEPSLSLYCTSTPDEFYSALSSEAVHNGLLNRFIILHSCDNLPEEQDGADVAPPAELVTEFVRHAMAAPEDGGNLRMVHMADISVPPSLMIVHRTPAAVNMLRLASAFQDQQIATDRATGKLWSRLVENATKVAMIRAISRDPEQPTMTDDDVGFGVDIVGRALGDLAVEVKKYVADNAVEADAKRVLRYIQEGGADGRTAAELSKNLSRIEPRRRRSIIDDLTAAGEVEETQERRGKRGKITSVVRAVQE